MITLTDDAEKEIALRAPAARIVSLVPSITETLFALGAGDRIVGRTRYCDRPLDEVKAVPILGGTKNPDLDAIAALGPDLILVNTEENRPEDIAALRGVALVYEDFARKVADGPGLIRALGKLTGTEDKAEPMALTIEQEIATIQELAAHYGRKRKAAYFIWKDPWMSVGRDTFIHDVLDLAGMENVFAGREERYPETTFEELAELAPEIIYLSSEPYPFKLENRNEFLDHEEIPAARMGRVYLVDGTYFCWYGARQLEALRWIRATILG